MGCGASKSCENTVVSAAKEIKTLPLGIRVESPIEIAIPSPPKEDPPTEEAPKEEAPAEAPTEPPKEDPPTEEAPKEEAPAEPPKEEEENQTWDSPALE